MERKCKGRTGRTIARSAAGRGINRRLDAGQVLFRKLKPGPGHSRAEVVENQRARLGAALIELAVEYGYETITVRGLSRSAGVSTGTFYSHFDNVEDCFVGTYESVMRQALDSASPKRNPGRGWEAEIRARMLSLMEAIAANPKAAQLVLVEAFAVRPEIQDRLGGALTPFEQLMTKSFNSAPTRAVAPPHLVSGIAAGVMCVARMTLLTGRAEELPGLADEVADWMLSLPSEQLLGAWMAQSRPPSLATAESADLHPAARPSGRDRGADERARVFKAVAKMAIAGGFERMTGPRIRAEAGVTRRRFDASFSDVTECFLGAVDAVTAPAATCAERQGEAAPTWGRGVHRAVTALCAEVARDERLAQLAFVDLLAPGRRGLLHRERLISLGAEHLYARAPYGARLGRLAAEASIASVWDIAAAEISTGRARALTRLAPLFTFLILAPAVGATAAVGAIRAEGLAALT